MSVSIDPQTWSDLSQKPIQGDGTNKSEMNTLDTTLNDLLNALNPLASQPYIGPGVTTLMNALDSAETTLKNSMDCFGTGLRVMGPAMVKVAGDFLKTDNDAAKYLQDLDSKLSNFENYGSTVANPTHPSGSNANNGQVPTVVATVPVSVRHPE